MTSSGCLGGSERNGPYLLGLDIGTLGVKGVLVGVDGGIAAHQERPHGVQQPRPGWVEQDAEGQWWGDGKAVIQALLAEAGVEARSIAAVGLCGLVPCLCPLDASGRPLRPAILYADNRALAELESINRTLGAGLTAQAVTPKLLWLKAHEPELFARIQAVVSAHHYAVYRLTGRLAVDYDTASIYGALFDAAALGWRPDLCRALEIPVDLLPTPCPATQVVGGVSPAAAEETGLAVGTPVIAGSGDTFPTIVGAGAVEPGAALVSLGTTGLALLIERPLEEVAAAVHFGPGPHGEPAAIRWAANVLTCGRALEWYREQLGGALGEAGASYAGLDGAAAQVRPGSDGLVALPHLLGRRTPVPDPLARGVFAGLAPSHTPAHLYRALLEGIGYAIRQGLEPLLSGRGGVQVRRVVATAGGARSSLWRQILSDILGRPVEYSPKAGGALGIAYLAGYATGHFPDLRSIAELWLGQPETVVPQADTQGVYERTYRIYCELDRVLEGVWGL